MPAMSTFIVTGASSGIGRATACALADRGVTVLAVARRGDALAELAAGHADLVRPVVADLSTDEGIATLVEAASAFDQIDGVVHGAGSIVPVEAYAGLSPNELTAHFRIHVATPIEINNRLGERLRGGRVLYIDSYSATTPRHGWSGYSILKAAAQMAARTAEQELDGVHVVRVFPGGVRTPLVDAVLASPTPAGDAFRAYDDAGEIVDPADTGRYIAGILLDATDAELAATEAWDFNA